MASYFCREIEEAFDVLETAFAMRKRMTEVTVFEEHIQDIKVIILKNVTWLCWMLRTIQESRPAPSKPEVMVYLKRMLEVKINLHDAMAEVFQAQDSEEFDKAMSAAFKFVQD